MTVINGIYGAISYQILILRILFIVLQQQVRIVLLMLFMVALFRLGILEDLPFDVLLVWKV